MSVVDDVRKLLQDLVAPDLRAIHSQLEGMEKTMAAKFEAAGTELKFIRERFENLESLMDLKFAHMDRRFDQVIDYTKMREQMDEIQKWRQEVSGKTTKQ